MQQFNTIATSEKVKDLPAKLNNTLNTLLSQSAGAAFPSTDLVVGMPCARTDWAKLYVCTNTDTVTWTEMFDFATGQAPDSKLLGGLDSSQFVRADSNSFIDAVATFRANVVVKDSSFILSADSVGSSRILNTGGKLHIQTSNDDGADIRFAGYGATDVPDDLYIRKNDAWNRIWGEHNQGTDSGMDADLLDGQHGSYYRAWANLTDVPTEFAPAAHSHDDAYLGKTAAAADSMKLEGVGKSGFVQTGVATTVASDTTWQQGSRVKFGALADARSDGTDLVFDLLSGNGIKIKDTDADRFTFDRVTGDFTATGNVTAYSDKRLKENLEGIGDALLKVSQLTGYTYDRKDLGGADRQAGLLAQDVQKVLPECVKNADNILSLNYSGLTGLLVNAINELSDRVVDLENRNVA